MAYFPAALRLGISALELELFVFLGTAASVLWLGLPLFLLYDGKKKQKWEEEEKKIKSLFMYRYLYIFHRKGKMTKHHWTFLKFINKTHAEPRFLYADLFIIKYEQT